jgi:hypothetical protein
LWILWSSPLLHCEWWNEHIGPKQLKIELILIFKSQTLLGLSIQKPFPVGSTMHLQNSFCQDDNGFLKGIIRFAIFSQWPPPPLPLVHPRALPTVLHQLVRGQGRSGIAGGVGMTIPQAEPLCHYQERKKKTLLPLHALGGKRLEDWLPTFLPWLWPNFLTLLRLW